MWSFAMYCRHSDDPFVRAGSGADCLAEAQTSVRQDRAGHHKIAGAEVPHYLTLRGANSRAVLLEIILMAAFAAL